VATFRGVVVDVGEKRGHFLVRGGVVVHGQGDLLEVIRALRTRRRLPDFLDRGHQKADQDRDDGNHHQELDQREAIPPATTRDVHSTPFREIQPRLKNR
jgi:hypothetical protein